MKVRIKEAPHVHEVDGVPLTGLVPGAVRDLSSSLATWLIAEQYAEPEMRHDVRDAAQDFSGVITETRRETFSGGPRRRADDS